MYDIRRMLAWPGTAFAERIATVFCSLDGNTTRRCTYREFIERCERVGSWLSEVSAPGDRIAVWASNSDRYLELFVGIPCAGRVFVPLNTRWAEPEVAAATRDSGASLLICDRAPGAVADSVGEVVRLDDNSAGGYEARTATASGARVDCDVSADTLAGLFYTGGTTGVAKGVMLTHGNLIGNALAVQIGQPLKHDDQYLTVAPMFHAAGVYCALSALLAGATNVIVDGFDAERTLDVIEAEQISCLIAVPTMLAALNEAQRRVPRDVSSLRWLSHGASPVALEVLRHASELFNCELIHLYGATETAPIATILRHEQRSLNTPRGKSAGIAAPGVEVCIDRPDHDGIGEVVVRGPNVMRGYWNQPETTTSVLSDDGWYRTGDIGYMDDGGYLFLVDRAKDMIVTGGENVYCTEVEDAIYSHPAVLEATVFGIPDDTWGELVHAVVVRRPGVALSTEQLVDHCKTLIANYKVPKSVEFSDEPLPKSGPGKVLKRQLRAPYWAGKERQIN